ncbi:hypothetical protein [Pandoraea sp.]|uniref:hypothetical protein n=1 Tax=Pandoraea sp. TaxID=1883445 RepID=UPI0025FB1E2C|nr:hypothetical protein [Pandoraea sp.]
MHQQQRVTNARLEARQAQAQVRHLRSDLAAARADTRVVTRYVDRVHTVRERGHTIVKEIPVYVSRKADTACPVPAGFVRLHDAAAANVPVGDPRGADAAASGLALSAVAGTVADNYTACHENAEQLSALQALLRERQPTPPP